LFINRDRNDNNHIHKGKKIGFCRGSISKLE